MSFSKKVAKFNVATCKAIAATHLASIMSARTRLSKSCCNADAYAPVRCTWHNALKTTLRLTVITYLNSLKRNLRFYNGVKALLQWLHRAGDYGRREAKNLILLWFVGGVKARPCPIPPFKSIPAEFHRRRSQQCARILWNRNYSSIFLCLDWQAKCAGTLRGMCLSIQSTAHPNFCHPTMWHGGKRVRLWRCTLRQTRHSPIQLPLLIFGLAWITHLAS